MRVKFVASAQTPEGCVMAPFHGDARTLPGAAGKDAGPRRGTDPATSRHASSSRAAVGGGKRVSSGLPDHNASSSSGAILSKPAPQARGAEPFSRGRQTSWLRHAFAWVRTSPCRYRQNRPAHRSGRPQARPRPCRGPAFRRRRSACRLVAVQALPSWPAR